MAMAVSWGRELTILTVVPNEVQQLYLRRWEIGDLQCCVGSLNVNLNRFIDSSRGNEVGDECTTHVTAQMFSVDRSLTVSSRGIRYGDDGLNILYEDAVTILVPLILSRISRQL